MNSENKHNDLQEILTQALEDLKNELGEKFDINKVNLAEVLLLDVTAQVNLYGKKIMSFS